MKPILISLGDPYGIGPEVTEKAISSLNNHPGIILLGHPDSLTKTYPLFTNSITKNEIKLIPILKNEVIEKKYNSAKNGTIAYSSIIEALKFSETYTIKGLVTAPISKNGLKNANISETDHTSILKHYFKKPNAAMGFYSDQLKVILATIHIPFSDIEKTLTEECIETAINNALLFAKKTGINKPRIGIAGLNPHAGENGQFGRFEIDILAPVIKKFINRGHSISNPISGDIIFRQGVNQDFDIIIAMYHDQGLIPVKLLAFDSAVNVTIGLPICRTSPDHGTAYDIAHTNKANPNAMVSAIDYVLKFGS